LGGLFGSSNHHTTPKDLDVSMPFGSSVTSATASMRADYGNLSVLMMMIIKQSFSGTQTMWKISQAPREALDQVSPGMGGQLATLSGLLARCGGDEFGPLDRRRRPPPSFANAYCYWYTSDFFLGNPFSPNFAIKEEYSAEIPPFAEENLLADFSRKTCFLRKIRSIVLYS
jgi:hypothetical protein